MMELRIALRTLRRQPGIALTAILALGLGIGLPAAMFSVIRAVAWRGLPVEQGQRIIDIERRPVGASGEGWGVDARDWSAWRESQRSFEDMGAYTTGNVALRIDAGAVRAAAGRVTANSFDLLRVRAAFGRTFRSGEDTPGAEPVVVLSHTLWRDRFGSDPGVLGRTVYVDGRPATVVGVMPEGFQFPVREDLWVPFIIPANPVEWFPAFSVFGRLAGNVSLDAARTEFELLAARVAERFPESNRNMGVALKPFTVRYMGETAMLQMLVLLGAVLLVLIIACTNVANLLLVRAVQRVRELAVRAALGAGRRRLISQLLLESALLAVLGGALGLLVAWAGMRGLGMLIGAERLPYWAVLQLDPVTLLFAALLTLFAAVVAGILPAFKAMGANVSGMLRDESRGASSMRLGVIMQGLVVLQIGFSLALLVTTGLMLLSVRRVHNVKLGFATANVVTAQFTFPESYDENARRLFFAELERRLAAEPAVAGVAIASSLPASRASIPSFRVEGLTYDETQGLPRARRVSISHGFFDAYQTAITRGRAFTPQDARDGQPVTIVNERFAQRFFPGQDALGKRIRLGPDSTAPWRTIVGIVPDLWMAGMDSGDERNPAGVYVPLAQVVPAAASLAVRAGGSTGDIGNLIRNAVSTLDPDVPVFDLKPMTQLIQDNSWFYGMGAAIVSACGITALLLATIGLYGVVAFSVGQRLREFGIRMAVGATPASIVALVLRRSSVQIAIGSALGIALALAIGQGVATLMFNVSPTDPVVYASLVLFLVAVTIAATLIPASRAARTDPLETLRAQ
jgi:predicted permease